MARWELETHKELKSLGSFLVAVTTPFDSLGADHRRPRLPENRERSLDPDLSPARCLRNDRHGAFLGVVRRRRGAGTAVEVAMLRYGSAKQQIIEIVSRDWHGALFGVVRRRRSAGTHSTIQLLLHRFFPSRDRHDALFGVVRRRRIAGAVKALFWYRTAIVAIITVAQRSKLI